ncbi:MAG: metallophosphoesterase [Candidatus Cloacimonetes bacterium]|jgi:predicted phosphodiesterase|nr:metallophosphoesterase [Candidatus Cloacimonadota bacterium]
MSIRNFWNKQNLKILHTSISQKGLSFEDVAKILKTTAGACERRYTRTDWDSFILDRKTDNQNKKWSPEELKTLYALRRESRSPTPYIEISKKLNRSPISVERKFQTTNWEKIVPGHSIGAINESDEIIQQVKNADKNNMAYDLVDMSRGEVQRFLDRTEDDFLNKTGRDREELDPDFDFEEIREIALDIMKRQGYFYPETKEFNQGRFLVVGDSHGKETPRGVFSLIQQMDKDLGFESIIHIGHILDDEWDISCCWEDFKKKLVVLAKKEELEILAGRPEEYEVIRSSVELGGLSVKNQDLVTNEYSVGVAGNVTNKNQYFERTTLFNLHRIELDTRTTEDRDVIQIYAPGCLCRKHISRHINMSAPFNRRRKASKAINATIRRKGHQANFWEQGLAIVDLDKSGEFSVTLCQIHEIDNFGFTTSYGSKIYTEDKIHKPDLKVFVNADPHSDLHDPECLDLQEQICKKYAPDRLVNLGDSLNNQAFNHHMMSRNEVILNDGLKELATTNFIFSRMRKWAPEMYLLFGNHERFLTDFCKKMPQLSKLLDFGFLTGIEDMDIKLIGHKVPLHMGPLVFIHGELVMFGARGGNKMDKARQTFGNNVVMGHTHSPATRQSCHTVGYCGLQDQGYNEPHASKWTQGYAYCNVFKGKAFIHNITMSPGLGFFAGNTFKVKNPKNWIMNDFAASIKYSFK